MKLAWSLWRSRWAAFFHDSLSIPVAWLGAYWLRFNLGEIPPDILRDAIAFLPWVILLQTMAFWVVGLYRGVWRFASLPDLIRILKAIMIGTLMSVLAVFLAARLHNLPRSVLPLYSILLLLILGGSRLLYRGYKDRGYFIRNGMRVLVVGAGSAGESLVRDLLRDKNKNYLPVAFVDDAPGKQGRELHGIRVMGTCDLIPDLTKRYLIDRIIIALPSAKASVMRRIVALCESTQIPVQTLPNVNDLVSGRVSVENLRKISLEDLLGRDPVTLDWHAIGAVLANKVVLISGGGGSIGSELCRQVMRLQPKKLIIIDNCEYNLFSVQQFLSGLYPDKQDHFSYHLIDLCDVIGIKQVVSAYRPQVIFHAAAFKHVPLLEPQVRAAAKNNILGTYFLAQVAITYRVEKFVLVSSDKAVNPTNVMGATKRVAELVCQYLNEDQITRFITVRFGNVLGSRGSVVETFQRQLEQGGPITVTDPEVMRYFMTVQEASQLILQALAIGEGGELFVLDMGEPVKIRYMAEQMIRLAGKRLGEEIRIEYVGLRPGEKLFEELFHPREQHASTKHPKILKAHPRLIEGFQFEKRLMALQKGVEQCEEAEILEIIKALVPELSQTRTEKQATKETTKEVTIL